MVESVGYLCNTVYVGKSADINERNADMATEIVKMPCECGIKGSCRCNSMSIQPCGWCDWWDFHGDEMDCEKALYWCNGCDDYCEPTGCTWCD